MNVTGWFQIGWSRDFPCGHLEPMRYFGIDLVAWRSENGTLCVVDAYCPHQGAHLGYGGSVHGEAIRCPLHMMEWSLSGESVGGLCTNALRTRPTREVSGLIYLWHDADGGAPWYEPEDIFEVFDDGLTEHDFSLECPGGTTLLSDVTIHPQRAAEDRVDRRHFAGTHSARIPHFLDAEFLEDRFLVDFVVAFDEVTGKHTSGLQTVNLGLGVTYLRAWGRVEQRDVLAVTPVDGNVSNVFHTLWALRHPEVVEGALFTPERYAEVSRRELHGDLKIWSRQRFTPLGDDVRDDDKELALLRSWAERFYPRSW